ncbi:hypothetical protein [Flindersiella endophytica]
MRKRIATAALLAAVSALLLSQPLNSVAEAATCSGDHKAHPDFDGSGESVRISRSEYPAKTSARRPTRAWSRSVTQATPAARKACSDRPSEPATASARWRQVAGAPEAGDGYGLEVDDFS